MLKPFSPSTSTVSLPWMTSKWLDLASASLLFYILWNLLQLYGFFPYLPVLIATILSPSLIVAVFRAEPDISEFQAKLSTAGNSVCRRCSYVILFSNSDEFPLLNCGSRGGAMFSTKYRFMESHGHLGNYWDEGEMIVLSQSTAGPWHWVFIKNMPLQGIIIWMWCCFRVQL